jgi:hypothetical protein
MMFCCGALESYVSAAGERGIAVLVEQTGTGLMFVLQSRGVAYKDEAKLGPLGVDLQINIASSTGMSFCPWCGVTLADLATASPEAFAEIARQHLKFKTLQNC